MKLNHSWPDLAGISIVACSVSRGRGLPTGHAQPAEVQAASRERVLPGRLERASAGGRHGRARDAAERRAFFTGKVGAALVTEMPFPVDSRSSTAASSATTSTARRATTGPAAATAWSCSADTVSRRRCTSIVCGKVEIGHFFDVMTNGFGAMPDYKAQITPRDRWNIVAYIRALQLSQHAAAADIPGGDPTKVRRRPQAPSAPARADTSARARRRMERWADGKEREYTLWQRMPRI